MKKLIGFFSVTLLASCSDKLDRKVMLLYNGEATVTQNLVTNKTNPLFNSTEFDLSNLKNIEKIDIEKDGKKYSIAIPKEPGYYVLNISADTIYGARKPLITPPIDSANKESVKIMVDSIESMLQGENISIKKSNFRILPEQLALISPNTNDVRAFAPYKSLGGSIEATESGKEPEIYKFNATEEMLFELKNYKQIIEPVKTKMPAKK